MCHLYPYKNVKLLWKFFYINICGFIGMGKFLYETRVLDSSVIEGDRSSYGVFLTYVMGGTSIIILLYLQA